MNMMMESGVAIYVALAVALAVWIGIFIYLWRLDVQARELRRRLDNQSSQETIPAPGATLRRQRPSDESSKGTGTQEARTIRAEQ